MKKLKIKTFRQLADEYNERMKNTISRTKAVQLINSSKGRRFTVTYTKQDGTTRTMNGSRKNQTPLGNITMNVTNTGYRTVNPNTITELRINGKIYSVR